MAWQKEDVKEASIYNREWLKTEAGIAYKKSAEEKKKLYRIKNNTAVKASQKQAYHKIRLEALQHYSKEIPECICCGEQGLPFLTLDHINGDGAAHRREIGMAQGDANQVKREKQKPSIGGNGFVYWLKKNGWPEGIQVMCANCNFAKRGNKECPHQTAKRLANK